MVRLFFRNDDVNTLDENLKAITEIFIELKIPISHAVEPANMTRETAEWLVNLKSKSPNLIEIIQHGYNHKKNVKSRGEFGGNRSFDEQYEDLKKGKEIMNDLFDSQWFHAFTFPFGIYNSGTIKALDILEYKVISTGFRFSIKKRAFNHLGQVLKQKFLFNKPINYFNKIVPKTKLLELPIVINLTKEILNEEKAIQKSLIELKKDSKRIFPKFGVVGFLLHHRWWSKDDLKTLSDFLSFLKSKDVQFLKMENFLIG